MKPILPLLALLALTGCARSQPAPATTSATLTAKDVPALTTPAASGLVIDTYEKGAYFGAFHDPKSAFTAEVAPYADGKSGHFLFGAYTVAPGGYAGLWGVPGEQWNHKQDWARAKTIAFDAFTSKPMTFSFTFKGDEGKKYSGSASTTKGGVWQHLTLAVSSLSDIASQIGLIGGFDLNIGAGGGSGQFAIDNLVVDGGAEPQTGDNGQPLELRASVVFAKTLTAPAARSHKTYVVDGAKGADANVGTAQNPFASIQHAANVALPGDTVLVKNGTYFTPANPHGEAAVVTRSGAPGFPITFRAAPGAHPTAAFTVRESAYVVIDGFDVTTDLPQQTPDTRKEPYGIGLDHAHHVRVTNCTVHNCGGGGIGTGFCDYIIIENNTVHDTAFSSIYNGSGISLWENRALDDKPGPHCVVRGNICYHNENKGPTPLYGGELTDGNGIILDWQRGVAPVLIENNICYDNGGRGIHVFHAKGVVVRHNTLVGNERTHGAKGCDLRANTSENVQFTDNIVVGRAGQSSTPNYLPKNVTYTHNLFYNYVAVDPDGQSAQNIVGKDPQFANASLDPNQADFSLQPGSPAAGLGAASAAAREAQNP